MIFELFFWEYRVTQVENRRAFWITHWDAQGLVLWIHKNAVHVCCHSKWEYFPFNCLATNFNLWVLVSNQIITSKTWSIPNELWETFAVLFCNEAATLPKLRNIGGHLIMSFIYLIEQWWNPFILSFLIHCTIIFWCSSMRVCIIMYQQLQINPLLRWI